MKPECQGEKLAVRKDSQGVIQEALSILQMDGYRCYSEADDTAWRDRLALCCASPGVSGISQP